MEREVDSVVNDIHRRDEQYDDGRHLSPELLIRDEDRECDDIDNKAQDPHRDTDVARDVESLSIYHSFSPLTEHYCGGRGSRALSPIVISLSLSKHK